MKLKYALLYINMNKKSTRMYFMDNLLIYQLISFLHEVFIIIFYDLSNFLTFFFEFVSMHLLMLNLLMKRNVIH